MDSNKLLKRAIDLAQRALQAGNYPCGAVIADQNGIIAEGMNESFTSHDITAHAEIRCLQLLDIKNLADPANRYLMVTSTEPCGGCSFFIARTRAIRSVTWALTDPQNAGFEDFSHDPTYRELFSNITVTGEPDFAFRAESAQLFHEYYRKTNQPEKAALYLP